MRYERIRWANTRRNVRMIVRPYVAKELKKKNMGVDFELTDQYGVMTLAYKKWFRLCRTGCIL
jgi:hypothetical protein